MWSGGSMVVACGLVVLAVHAAAGESAPSRVVSRLNAGLLDVLTQAQKLGYEGRFQRLAPVVDESFDIGFMAEKSLGRHWKALGDADRARWVGVFREFTTANYAGNFDKYSGQRFDVLGEEPAQNETMVVRTLLVNPAGENVELNYRLHQVGTTWKIVDVFLKGTVSELALRRSDYASVLERDGFEVLVSTVRGKIADLAAGRGKRSDT